MFKILAVVAALGSTTLVRPRERRQSGGLVYDGEFPRSISRTSSSIFDSPRTTQGIEQDLLRRYKHMEKLIMFYDPSLQNITKYWTYGCWCLQMGDFPMRLGNGQPQDEVDRVCKKQKECYLCAKKDHEEEFPEVKSLETRICSPDMVGYKFKAIIDPVTGKPAVECTNIPNTCRRRICECDKRFAEQLPGAASASEGWQEAHHAHFGGFDSRVSCMARMMGHGNHEHELQCCGNYPERYLFRVRSDGSGRQCCGSKTYNSDSHVCCDEITSDIKSHGTC
jgi:hypothetical protein